MKNVKHFMAICLTALTFGFAGFAQAQIIPPSCNFGSNVIPCPGFILGQENSGSLGSFTGTEEWSALGKSPFPAPSGDVPYGIRLQRNLSTALYQVEQRVGTSGSGAIFDSNILFGNVIVGPSATRVPPFNRMDLNYVQQNQTSFPPSARIVNIMTLIPATSKQVTPSGLTAICLATQSPCFGRVGIERTNPSFTLDVNGIGRATAWILTSDARYKKDIQTIDNGMAIVNNLRGTTYEFVDSEGLEGIDFAPGLRSGFIAQEVEEVLPHLVFTDDNGYKSVDYIGVVPYLVEGVQSLSEEQAILLAELEALKAQMSGSDKGQVSNSSSSEAPRLSQNTPNPADQGTEISYYLPENVQSAALLVFDMNGVQLRSIEIENSGEGSVAITAGEFPAGMYFYTLVTDGKEVATKRMILTQ